MRAKNIYIYITTKNKQSVFFCLLLFIRKGHIIYIQMISVLILILKLAVIVSQELPKYFSQAAFENLALYFSFTGLGKEKII